MVPLVETALTETLPAVSMMSLYFLYLST